jgi:hypothetical protein
VNFTNLEFYEEVKELKPVSPNLHGETVTAGTIPKGANGLLICPSLLN